MGRAADGKVASGVGSPDYGDPKTSAIKHDIERTRDEMEDTVNAIETRLSPSRIKEQITSVKEHALGEFRDATHHVKDEIAGGIEDAKDKVKSGIGEARAAVREATVGKVEHMVHRASTQVKGAGNTVVDTIRENPIPAALVGFGVAWLLMGARSQRHAIHVRRFDADHERHAGGRKEGQGYGSDYGYYESERVRGTSNAYGTRDYGGERFPPEEVRVGGEILDKAGETAREAADKVRHVAGDIAVGAREKFDDARDVADRFVHGARDRASHMVHEGRNQVMRVERGAEHIFEENPLAVGAVAFALGAAAGLALPSSHAEDRIFGEAKDRFMHKAGDVARDALKQVEDKASTALHGAAEGSQEKDKPAQGQAQQGERRI